MRRHTWIAWVVMMALGPVATAHAEIQTRTVPYEHDGQALEGYLAWDDSMEGERPGVLVVHEWWGLNDYVRRRCDQLAELGYVAFALDMYGDGAVAADPGEASAWAGRIRQDPELWRGRAMAGLEVLRDSEQADADRLAAIGYCFGGTTALQLAYAGAELRGAVSFHGNLPTPTADEARGIRPRLLICHGAVDPAVPEEDAQRFRAALEDADADYQMIYYAGALHSFTNPAADDRPSPVAAYDEAADRRSWLHMRAFFEEVFE